MTVAEKRAKARAVHVGFCCKCKTTKSTIIVRYAEYCDRCFLIALDSKFRTALRNARPYRVITPENVMLAFSGGSSSRSLIHLFDVFHSLPPEVASNKQQPKIYNDIHVCHVDESSLFDAATSEQDSSTESTMEKAQEIAAGYGYPFHGVRIEDIYDPEWTDSGCFDAVATLMTSLPKDQLAISGEAPELLSRILPRSSTAATIQDQERTKLSRHEKVTKLKSLLAACTTLTAKETILQHFRSSLLVQLTRRAHCTILALGDSATRVAVQIIGLTAIGRGYSLPHETSLLSNWIEDCKVIRPLKDCLAKELETHCRLNHLERIEQHSAKLDWSVKTKGEVRSIKRLTEEFITGLDKDFPSTVATVCRTAAKLTPPEVLYKNKCPLCHGPVQEGVQEWKKRITVTTAPRSPGDNALEDQVIEASGQEGCCSPNGSNTGCCGSHKPAGLSLSSSSLSCSTAMASGNLSLLPFSSLLCYGCLTNLRDLDLKSMGSRDSDDPSLFDLPPYVAESILNSHGYASLEDHQKQILNTVPLADPRESLREQIQEFLIASDDDDDDDDDEG
ncbi:Cytoplasmic tRNA 2-thiolation protein 2 [Mortierella claussenii]|nr:Cytoplasmic tRNA 2-thiolation protein 2 [Mortierella claussenii]